ncbi:hypothetical protein TaPaz_153 [Acinetobacter phage TaPaz]|nr:hypothetical protein TaPaz_153 [Acinetobacter phage TaPaz]
MDWIFIGVGFLIGIYIYFNCIHGKFIINNKGSIVKVKSLDQIKREYQANMIWAYETFGSHWTNDHIYDDINSTFFVWNNVTRVAEPDCRDKYPSNFPFPKCKIGSTQCKRNEEIPSWTTDFMIEFNQICDDMKNRITPEDLALYKKYGVSYKAILKD